MESNWVSDYLKTSANALTSEWFVSPLEYSWNDGKVIFDKAFPAVSQPHATFHQLAAPELFKTAMKFDFRAKMMVYAFMREDIAKIYALQIESGLVSLYGLDFISCLSQWIYVVEGYCRQLFQIMNPSSAKSNLWTIPSTGDSSRDQTISAVCKALGDYLDKVVYKSTNNTQTSSLNRHLMLHGNLQNSAFYSQKNCLSVMYVLDALVYVEMVMNGHFSGCFQDVSDEANRIERRKYVYEHEMSQAFTDPYLLKTRLFAEHI